MDECQPLHSGKKITGLHFMPGDDRKLLVTSNDSRIRVYDGYTLACKYKGQGAFQSFPFYITLEDKPTSGNTLVW